MPKKKKFEMSLDKKKSADFLRILADCIESDSNVIKEYDIDLSGYEKIKVALKQFDDQMMVKLKVNLPDTDDFEDADSIEEVRKKESFKKLKKRMEVYFEEMKDSVQKNLLPSREIVSVFLRDSETMVSMPGNGDEYYQEFKLTCSDLQKAFELEDLEELRSALSKLDLHRTRCHSKHK